LALARQGRLCVVTDDGRTWVEWHQEYDDPTSRLSQRLAFVQQRLREAIDSSRPGPIRVISVCAGQGRDVLGVLEGHERAADVRALLVELDAHNADAARTRAAAAGLGGVDVLQADAAMTAVYRDAVRADVLLLCGIFGNVSEEDIERTVRNTSRLCAPGATVLWTRGRWEPDLTPTIRRWFSESGFQELAFDSDAPNGFSVGTNRLVADPLPYDETVRLFSFLERSAGDGLDGGLEE
jgi:ubiquinone/menaquinone biosynthesis C-methylase UbiE